MTKVNKEKIIPVPKNYDFPEPIFDDEIDVGWDILTYLHKAAEYEKWAERARSCGQDDLAILYEIKRKNGSLCTKSGKKVFSFGNL